MRVMKMNTECEWNKKHLNKWHGNSDNMWLK
jgi:hypothetical protein